MPNRNRISRRQFVAAGAVGLSKLVLPSTGWAAGDKELRLLALGEALITHDLRQPSYPGYRTVADCLKQGDICFSNLEVAIRGAGVQEPARQGLYVHYASPQVLDCLQDMSINVLALSNNHSWDLGEEGIRSAIAETRQRGITCAGTGENLREATAPAYRDTPKGKVALVAMASKLNDSRGIATASKAGVNHVAVNRGVIRAEDARRNLQAIEQAAAAAEYVIVYQHNHYLDDQRQTPEWQKKWARACIDAGATLFVSHGPHRLHGIEIYRQRPIFYSLGNFVFHTRTRPGFYPAEVWDTVIADCRFDGRRLVGLKLVPLVLTEGDKGEHFLRTRGRPRPASREESTAILNRLQRLSKEYRLEIQMRDDCGEVRL